MNDDQAKKNGRVLAAIVFGMFAYFFGIHFANADLIVRDQLGNSVILYDKPCTDVKILAFITMKGSNGDRFKSGFMHYQGKDFEACWTAGPDWHVYVVDSEGDITRIPAEAFEKVLGV